MTNTDWDNSNDNDQGMALQDQNSVVASSDIFTK